MSRRIYAGTSSITWDDAWHRIDVNGYVLNLSPTQYRICRVFLTASKEKNEALLTDDLILLSYCSYDHLQEDANISHSALIKHISDINTRLSASELKVRSFKSGYILIFSFNQASNVRHIEERRRIGDESDTIAFRSN